MNTMNWLVAYPEIFLLLSTCVIAVADLFVNDPQKRLTYWLTQMTMGFVALMPLRFAHSGAVFYGLSNMVVADPMGHLMAAFAAIAMMITVTYAQPYLGSRDMLKGEFFVLSLFVLLGISVMCSANHFLVVYLGLEVMSLSLYALTALRRDHAVSTEAAMKYFVLGALASGFLLYGLSMMYGATGTLEIPQILQRTAALEGNRQVLTFGVVFVVAGLAFKLGAVPFHMWVPDVYQGSPTPVTLMIGGAPKLAAFVMTMRLLVEGLFTVVVDWQQMLVVLAASSLVVGNLAAIAQTNLKRMLAYSTIAQVGFLLLSLSAGVVNNQADGAAAAYSSGMFYIVSYVLTTLGSFGLIMLLSRPDFECEQISDLAGLAQRKPWLAGVMSVFMFSLAGVPPMVGFFAKLGVIQALVATGSSGYLTLAVLAVMMSLIGAFYYLRVVKVMYFDAPAQTSEIQAPSGAGVLLALNGLAVLALGPLSGGLITLCREALLKALAF